MERDDEHRSYKREKHTVIMERFRNIVNTVFAKFLPAFVRRARTENTAANVLWRSVLCAALFVALLIGTFAYITYVQVTAEPMLAPLTKNQRPAISTEELHEVITLYQKKETNYGTLLHASPLTPELGMGSGTTATEVGVPSSEM